MQATITLTAAAILAATLPAHADEPATPVVVIVRVPKPWYAPRSVVAGKMRDTLPQYARLPGLLFKAFSFERDSGDYGDEAMTVANVRTLLAALPNAPSVLQVLQPADLGLPRIGHLGGFRRGAAALWPRLAQAVEQPL
jgi:hypothetical protein